jgi:hypothetical protein
MSRRLLRTGFRALAFVLFHRWRSLWACAAFVVGSFAIEIAINCKSERSSLARIGDTRPVWAKMAFVGVGHASSISAAVANLSS